MNNLLRSTFYRWKICLLPITLLHLHTTSHHVSNRYQIKSSTGNSGKRQALDFGASVRSLQKDPEDSGNTLDKRLENLEKTGKRIKQSPERSITAEVGSFLYTKWFLWKKEIRLLHYWIVEFSVCSFWINALLPSI